MVIQYHARKIQMLALRLVDKESDEYSIKFSDFKISIELYYQIEMIVDMSLPSMTSL